MKSLKHRATGAAFAVVVTVFWHCSALAGEKIEITPSTPESKSTSALAPRMPSKLDLELDKLEGARIQSLEPGAPRMMLPSPTQRPADDRKNKDWLLESMSGNKPLDYNGILGVRDYSTKPGADSLRSSRSDFNSYTASRHDGFNGRPEIGNFDGMKRDSSSRASDSLAHVDRSTPRNSNLPDSLNGLRANSPLDGLPSVSRNADREAEAYRNRSALRAEVDSILNRPDSRFANPIANNLSVESVLRPPGTPSPATPRPSISQPTTARPTAAQEILKPVASPRDLSPAAAFAKENADALQPQRPKATEPERRKDEPRYRPSVLPLPKRGF